MSNLREKNQTHQTFETKYIFCVFFLNFYFVYCLFYLQKNTFVRTLYQSLVLFNYNINRIENIALPTINKYFDIFSDYFIF